MVTVPCSLDHPTYDGIELSVSRVARLLLDLDRLAVRVRGIDPEAPRLARIDRRLDELRSLVVSYSTR
jgi:hypothetical protein